MTNLEKQSQLLPGFQIIALAVVGLGVVIIGGSAFLTYGPRLEKPEFHWTRMGDFWIYSPSDAKLEETIDGIRFNITDPVGAIVKTDQGVWKSRWQNKPCGAGEYLNRELAEQCVENAAQNYGYWGYRFVMPRKQRPGDSGPPAN